METVQLSHGGHRAPRGSVPPSERPYHDVFNFRFRDGARDRCGFFTQLIALSCGRLGHEECYHPSFVFIGPSMGTQPVIGSKRCRPTKPVPYHSVRGSAGMMVRKCNTTFR